jgi:hypothetical protein
MILEFDFFFLFFDSSVNQVKIWHLLLSKRDSPYLSLVAHIACDGGIMTLAL